MDFSDMVKACGGRFLRFNHKYYLRNNIGAVYHEVEHNAETMDNAGLCAGLSAAFCIAHKTNVSAYQCVREFVQFIRSNDGAAMVDTVKADTENATKTDGVAGAESTVVDFFSNGFNRRCLKHRETKMVTMNPNELSTFVTKSPSHVMIGFDNHEAAVVNIGPRIMFFDPNYGTATFEGMGPGHAFRIFAASYLSSKYGYRYSGKQAMLTRFTALN